MFFVLFLSLSFSLTRSFFFATAHLHYLHLCKGLRSEVLGNFFAQRKYSTYYCLIKELHLYKENWKMRTILKIITHNVLSWRGTTAFEQALYINNRGYKFSVFIHFTLIFKILRMRFKGNLSIRSQTRRSLSCFTVCKCSPR